MLNVVKLLPGGQVKHTSQRCTIWLLFNLFCIWAAAVQRYRWMIDGERVETSDRSSTLMFQFILALDTSNFTITNVFSLTFLAFPRFKQLKKNVDEWNWICLSTLDKWKKRCLPPGIEKKLSTYSHQFHGVIFMSPALKLQDNK